MSEVDAVGDLVTGALAARAVEPVAGDEGHTHEMTCLNCSTPLVGPHCHQCGQKAHVHRSLGAFFHDLVHGVFHFEGKFWRTLPMLAWKPGDLTRRYIDGERANFISPVALFLFSVFLMFAVLNFTGAIDPTTNTNAINTNIEAARADEQARLKRLESKRDAAAAAGASTKAIDAQIVDVRADLDDLSKVRGGVVVNDGELAGAPSFIRHAIEKARANPELMIYKVQNAAYKFSWLLIPMSIPFLWLLFPFSRRFNLYDHTVFVTYSLSFMMMLAIVAGIVVAAGGSGFVGMLFFIPPIHMYRQLKGAYGLSRLGALVRTVLLTSFAFVAAMLFFLLMIGIGVL